MNIVPPAAPRSLADLLGVDAPWLLIHDVVQDARAATPGALFLAYQGARTHGLVHAAEAVRRGASAIAWEPVAGVSPPQLAADIVVTAIPQLRQKIGSIAARFFAQPSSTMTVAGVTGTNGKTTCVWLLAEALQQLQRPCGYMGTLGVGFPGAVSAAAYTTADAVTTQRALQSLRVAGAQCVAMEVSSHALDQYRVNGVQFHTAAFTNLTRDHLDYHLTMSAYGAAKARLMNWPSLRARVINVDDAFGRELAAMPHVSGQLILTMRATSPPPATPGQGAPANAAPQYVTATRCEYTSQGIELTIRSSFGDAAVSLPLIGEFNADNALTVIAMLCAQDISLTDAAAALRHCAAPAGRMQTLGGGSQPLAIVDYAHTPDALSKALVAARRHCRGTLHLVFGCGGDRDAGKRALMGAVAAQSADDIVLTDDNPRGEEPAAIVAGIISGLQAASYQVIHDRALAIRSALTRARASDVVLVAGKGHEDYQIYGTERRSFSDQAVVRAVLADLPGASA